MTLTMQLDAKGEALRLLESGFRPIPVGPDKRPLVAWQKYQQIAPSAEEVAGWWDSHPEAQVAVLTGIGDGCPGVLAVDVDLLPDPTTGTEKVLPNPWPGEGRDLAPGAVLGTPSGGQQYLYAHVEGVRNTSSVLAAGVDVRGEGGLTIVYGPGRRFLEGDLSGALRTPPPDWLLASLQSKKATTQRAEGDKIPRGMRNSTLTSIAGFLRHRGLETAQIEPTLLVANREACAPPLGDEEVCRIARSVGRYEPSSGGAGSNWEQLEQLVSPIEWAWPGWLPKGFLVLLAGDLGSGKSILALRIAASLIRGDDWPDATRFQGETGCVLWCEAESAQAINLSRAKDWGLPLERIRTPFEDPLADIRLDDPETMSRISRAASDPEVRLVVVDSFSGSHRKDENTLEAGRIAQSLATLARNSGKIVVASHHLRKHGANEVPEVTVERVRGSSSIAQYARVIWGIDTPDLGQPDRRRLSQIKNNLARFTPPIGFRIGDHGVQFCEAPVRPHVDSQTDKAVDLLLSLLRVKPRPAGEIQQEADGAGISWETMKRAKKRLGIDPIRKDNRWIWSLPAPEEAPF